MSFLNDKSESDKVFNYVVIVFVIWFALTKNINNAEGLLAVFSFIFSYLHTMFYGMSSLVRKVLFFTLSNFIYRMAIINAYYYFTLHY
ncbi:hypothetical protein H5203_18870 [Pseudoalteromonas sp. SG41-1]|uniref:hypothetical protein n=1 Tax=Pseudoalteromonas sp. SG41-1 TaxID=2760979 RepID=UPI0015FFBE78|nr:hypothetical protein [Pseudoalteromonas sp. SG41-1]MBB1507532.1 hypothetical protein [Pseudoalteromonas sp. SG41-1]